LVKEAYEKRVACVHLVLVVLMLMGEAIVLNAISVAKVLAPPTTPIVDLFGWRTAVPGVVSLLTLAWWSGLHQYYKGK